MELLQSLGLNGTFLIQFVIFTVTILLVYSLAFKPFAEALEERNKATVGSADHASELNEKSKELLAEFEVKAKEVNSRIKTVYDLHRAEAMNEYQDSVAHARAEAEKTLSSVRAEIAIQIGEARKALVSEGQHLSALITKKIIGRG